MRSSRLLLAALIAAGALTTGCRRFRGHAPSAPPFEAFKPGAWTSPKGKVVPPPDASSHPWRVLVLQEQPRPKKNPLFKTVPVAESGLLEMPAGSKFRCLYNPVQFRPWNNEMMKIERWEIIRNVRCSSDDFRSYAQAVNTVTFDGDGNLLGKSADQAELYLHELIGGKPFDVTIVLRWD